MLWRLIRIIFSPNWATDGDDSKGSRSNTVNNQDTRVCFGSLVVVVGLLKQQRRLKATYNSSKSAKHLISMNWRISTKGDRKTTVLRVEIRVGSNSICFLRFGISPFEIPTTVTAPAFSATL